MQQAQADKLDHWQFYQARNIREEIAKSTLAQLQLQALTAPASAKEAYHDLPPTDVPIKSGSPSSRLIDLLLN